MSLHPVAGAHPITPAQFEKMQAHGRRPRSAIGAWPFSFLALSRSHGGGLLGRTALVGLVIYSLGFGRGHDCAGDERACWTRSYPSYDFPRHGQRAVADF